MAINLRSHSGVMTEAMIRRYFHIKTIKKKCYKAPARIVKKYFQGMDPNMVDTIVEQALDAMRSTAEISLRRRDMVVHGRGIRDKYAGEHPICELCFERGIIVPTEEIHHKMPLSEGGTHDLSNLIALCKSSHSTIHAKRGDYWGRTMSGGHQSCADRSGDLSRVGAGEISTGTAPRERWVVLGIFHP